MRCGPDAARLPRGTGEATRLRTRGPRVRVRARGGSGGWLVGWARRLWSPVTVTATCACPCACACAGARPLVSIGVGVHGVGGARPLPHVIIDSRMV